MKDVMLINPSSKRFLRNAGDRVPLGICYLASALRNKGHKVRVRDMDHYFETSLNLEMICDPPEVVGISVYTSPVFKESIELAKNLKTYGVKLIAGGYHATAMPESLLTYFDTVIKGEAEITLPKVIEKGLTGIIEEEKPDMKDIPIPDRGLLTSGYWSNYYDFTQDGRPATTIITSRGCPNACIYCGNKNQRTRFHSDEHVIKELKEQIGFGFKDFYICDDAFTSNKDRTMQLLDKMKPLNINFRLTTRAKSLDEDIVKKLKEAGCTWASIGIESGDNDILRNVHKNMTVEDNEHAVELLHKYDIKVKGFFMFGLPGENMESAYKTINFSKKLISKGLVSADFYIMTPFPGTPLWNNPEKYGINILNKDYTKYMEAGIEPPTAFHDNGIMTRMQIQAIRNKAEKEFKGALECKN